MEILVKLEESLRVSAELDGHTIITDQPVSSGGKGILPTPYQLFLASLGTCAGVYVADFCAHRGISSDRISIRQTMEFTEGADGKRQLKTVGMEIMVPNDFPAKYHNALVKSAELCAVKKAIASQPGFVITTTVIEE